VAGENGQATAKEVHTVGLIFIRIECYLQFIYATPLEASTDDEMVE
jgi:hypothetical protein